MKTKFVILVLALCTSYFNSNAQTRVYTTTRATSNDISDNLDLDAVSSIFADSKDLQEFEYRLNDPDNRISNLDLNQDGYVDYLRVVETTDDRNSLVVIQAVLDDNIYQDVATIEIEREQSGLHRIQVVGDPWIYGANYIIEPVFVRTPLIFSFFWGPRYAVWHSPYYWGFYPGWFYRYKPYPTYRYSRHVTIYVDRRVTFNRINERHFNINDNRFNTIRRRDFADRHPERSFENRHRESTKIGPQNQRQPSRIGNGNNTRTNENVRRNTDQNRVGQERRQTYQNRQSGSQQRREYTSPNQVQQKTPANEQQRATQSKPAVQERSNNQNRSRVRNEVKQSQQNSGKAEPAKKEEKKESRERRRK